MYNQQTDALSTQLTNNLHTLDVAGYKTPKPTSRYPTGTGATKGDLLMQRLRFEFGYDPIEELVNIAQDKKTSSGDRIKIATELLSYYQPKMKAMDFNPDQGEVIKINISFPDKESVPAGIRSTPDAHVLTDEELKIIEERNHPELNPFFEMR